MHPGDFRQPEECWQSRPGVRRRLRFPRLLRRPCRDAAAQLRQRFLSAHADADWRRSDTICSGDAPGTAEFPCHAGGRLLPYRLPARSPRWQALPGLIFKAAILAPSRSAFASRFQPDFLRSRARRRAATCTQQNGREGAGIQHEFFTSVTTISRCISSPGASGSSASPRNSNRSSSGRSRRSISKRAEVLRRFQPATAARFTMIFLASLREKNSQGSSSISYRREIVG